jgi:hypothetical protein
VTEGQVVEVRSRDLLLGDDHVVAVRPARDRERRVEQSNVPGRTAVPGDVEAAQRAMRGPLGREAWTVHDDIARLEVHVGAIRAEHRHEVLVRGQAGQGAQVVSAIDRRAIVDVVGPGRDHRPDLRARQAPELRGDPLDGPAGLGVGVEQVAGDEEEIDLRLDGEIDGCLEGGKLALALRAGLLAQVRVPGAEVDIRGMEDPEHPVAGSLPARRWRRDGPGWAIPIGPPGGPGVWSERGAPKLPSLGTPESRRPL